MAVDQAAIGASPAPRPATLRRWLSRAEASEPARLSAARRALRTGVVTLAAFAVGRWGVGSVVVAVFATFTALAITGIADFGGSRRGRAAAVTATVALGIGLTALGTWTSGHGPWVGCAVMFGVVAAVALCGLLGGYAAAGSNALILFYVVAAGSAAPVSVIGDRIEGVALGGGFALAAALLLWPEPARPRTLPQLGAAVQDLAARVARLAGDVTAGLAGPASQNDAQGIRACVDALVDRPAAPTRTQRAELYLLNDVERLGGLVTRFEQTAGPDDADVPVLQRCASVLSWCGEGLSAAAADGSPPGPAAERPIRALFGLAARLAVVTDAVRSHAWAALGRPPDGKALDASTIRGGWEDVVHGIRRFRANLTVRSVHVHDALRLGAGLALAVVAVDAFDLQHGFWVAFATLTVIKSNVRATGRSVGEAVTGTLVGFLVAFALIASLEPSIGWYLALLPIVVTAAIYANVAVSFLAGQAGFTLVIIVLFNLLGPAGWGIGIVRIVDVVAGALAGLLIGALAWPRGASATMGRAVADLLETGASYLAATARAFVGEPSPQPHAAARQHAADAAVRADSCFAQYLTEHPPPQDLTTWAHWISTGNRLWYAADLIAATPRHHASPASRTAHAAHRLVDGYRTLAADLRHRTSPPAAPAGHPAATAADLPAWLDDLAGETPAPRLDTAGSR
jgi:uncharacterized membrane protein YccC